LAGHATFPEVDPFYYVHYLQCKVGKISLENIIWLAKILLMSLFPWLFRPELAFGEDGWKAVSTSK
jgi:hypothetical protein